MPEMGTSVNGGIDPPRGNGEGLAKASPLPTLFDLVKGFPRRRLFRRLGDELAFGAVDPSLNGAAIGVRNLWAIPFAIRPRVVIISLSNLWFWLWFFSTSTPIMASVTGRMIFVRDRIRCAR